MRHIWGWYLTSLLCPFLVWAFLAVLARRHRGALSRLYPWLTALCWVLWLSVIVLMLGNLLTPPTNKLYLKFWLLIAPASSGFILVRNMIGRRVDPKAYAEKPDGWWPAPKSR